MIRSMTGYGQGSAEAEGLKVTVELRSVNNRFADLKLRLPDELLPFEPELRRVVLATVKRGRVDLDLRVERTGAAATALVLNRAVVDGALAALKALRDDYGVQGEWDLKTLMRIPGLLERPGRADGLDPASRETVDRALSAATVPEAVQKRIVDRVQQLVTQIALDPARVAQEAAFLADRADVTEETVRLSGHLVQATSLLTDGTGEPVGKRLDFLLQEINRETNTIASKSADLEMSRRALDLKAEGEKIREQIQNLE